MNCDEMEDQAFVSNIVNNVNHANDTDTGKDEEESSCYTNKRFDENEVDMLYDVYKIAWKQMRNMVEVHKRDNPDGRILAWVVKPSVDTGENATSLKVSMVLTLCQPQQNVSRKKEAVVKSAGITPKEVAFGKESPLFTEVSCSSASQDDAKLEKTDDNILFEYDSVDTIIDDDGDDGIDYKSTADIVEHVCDTQADRRFDLTNINSDNKIKMNNLDVVCSFNKDTSFVINNASLPTTDNARWRIINPATLNTTRQINDKIECDKKELPDNTQHVTSCDFQQNTSTSDIIYLRKTSNPSTAEETAQCFYSKAEVQNFLHDNYGKQRKKIPPNTGTASKSASMKRPPNQVQVVTSRKIHAGTKRTNVSMVVPDDTPSSEIRIHNSKQQKGSKKAAHNDNGQQKKSDNFTSNDINVAYQPRRKRSRPASTNSSGLGFVPLRRWCQSRCCHQTCWTAIWQHLQLQGWKEHPSEEKANETTDPSPDLPGIVYYLPPNGKVDGGRKGTHFFVDSADVMDYCKKKY